MGRNKWISLKGTGTGQCVCSICCSPDKLRVLSLDGRVVRIELRPESKMHDFVLCLNCIRRMRTAEIWE